MNELSAHPNWPALEKGDAGLKSELEKLLTVRAVGNPYGIDSNLGANIASLPRGLRAMAATHWLGLHELADCFVEAKELMIPLLASRTEADGDPYEILERAGLRERSDQIDSRAWDLNDIKLGKSAIYDAWIQYA
jgi:hypothetical protein